MDSSHIPTVDAAEWQELFVRLQENLETIRTWEHDEPQIEVLRCEHSRHRTLAHLRACQEQWFSIVESFIQRDKPSVKVLHPWRLFDQANYATVEWDLHMQKFIEERHLWLAIKDTADRERGGRWNGKVDTIVGLTRRLASHESHHIRQCP